MPYHIYMCILYVYRYIHSYTVIINVWSWRTRAKCIPYQSENLGFGSLLIVKAADCQRGLQLCLKDTPLKTNGWNLKIPHWKRRNIDPNHQILGFHVCFRGCIRNLSSLGTFGTDHFITWPKGHWPEWVCEMGVEWKCLPINFRVRWL